MTVRALCCVCCSRLARFTGIASGEPNRQRHSKTCIPGFGRDLYLTVVFVDDDIVGDMQTQSRAGARSLRSKEGFENAPLDLGGNSGPVVDDLDYDVAVFGIVL